MPPGLEGITPEAVDEHHIQRSSGVVATADLVQLTHRPPELFRTLSNDGSEVRRRGNYGVILSADFADLLASR
ncbi:MAG: hypothetical protein C0434_00635 [Xanthomonadaceae bacterium]|nr:hypothetical protein [Xanthomonadaceae bacterium]